MAHLIIKTGDRAGDKIPLSRVTCIGRGMDMDVRLDDLTVSKRHARILRNERAEYVLEDLASSNGTFLNDKQVTTKPLTEGDRITIGQTAFEFRRPEAESAAAPRRSSQTLINIEKDETTASHVKTSVDAGYEPSQDVALGETTVEELSEANRRLRTLLEIGKSIGTALDEDELLERILDNLFEVFPETNRGFIILREPDTGRLTPAKRRVKKGSSPEDEQLQVSETILEYVLERKQGVLIADTMSDERLPTSRSILDFEMRSVMCAPLKYEEQVLGFIQLDTDRIAANYDDDGLTLLVGIANQCALTIANARLHRQLVRRERLERDLQNARRIQNSFLPQSPPRASGYEFEDAYSTALEVGGDFYDFVQLGDGKVVIVVGDVSGKGITAALMMAKMASNVRFFATTQSGPSALLQRLNEVALSSETDMFVTVLIMYLDCAEHELRMSNAGHCYPLLRKSSGEVQRLEGGNGYPVGIMEEAEFPEADVLLEERDVVCVFTDGIVEAMNEQQQQFGYKRLIREMTAAPSSPEEVVRTIQKAIREHAGGAAQSDDLTLVCFGRTGEAGGE
ncbi:MAG: SpoIIE family protein phosphatase [Candidatus Brocadiaceae bacterium]|jgi:serine phosphatase RsbU (regulator of sigma subunit)/pSer/pThr/pTyr-binding forkhead associated (FHA) protein